MSDVSVVDEAGFEVLSRSACLRLLERGGLGRVTLPGEGEVPALRTMNFVLDSDRIVMRTGDTQLWRAAQEKRAASFGVDEGRNLDHTGWSVIVTGHLHLLPADERVRALPLRSWAPTDRDRFVALAVQEATGRRAAQPRGARSTAAQPTRDAAVDGDGVDHWGRSERTRRVVSGLIDPIYRRWFRVEWEALERVPRRGGALLVANHAGAIPLDAPLIMHGIERDVGRRVYALHDQGLRAVPYLGALLARNGGVVAHPDNAVRLLRDEGQLLLVFPEGAKGTTKPYSDRYRLARFGRGGFVESAMRAGVPVVPIAVVGTEEIMPTLVRLPPGEEVGWPVTLNGLLFGPLGALVSFPAKVRARVLEPVAFDQPPGLERYPRSVVADAAEDIRAELQAALVDIVAARRDPGGVDVRRVLVTSSEGPLAEAVLARLGRRRDLDPDLDLDLVERLDTWEYGRIVDLLAARDIDTVIHLDLLAPSRPPPGAGPAAGQVGPAGAALAGTDARVIRSMRLAAAVGRRDGPVRTLIVASSASVYPASSRAPLWHGEHETLTPPPHSQAAALVEAEDYVRDVASSNPHIAVAILRLAELVGPGATSPLGSLLRRPFVPVAAGFDPSVQFLHVDDAAAAVEHAARAELAGLYNVAAPDTIRWRRAIAVAGRRPMPVIPAALGPLSSRLRFGRCLDTERLTATGFRPAHRCEDCVRASLRSWTGGDARAPTRI